MSDDTRDPEVEALGAVWGDRILDRIGSGQAWSARRLAIEILQAGLELGERRATPIWIADAVRVENEACAEAVAAFARDLPEGPGPQVIVRQLIDAAEAAIRARRKQS